ncbi:MAG: hypothetical protein CALGDGBN_03428 [Pseudomonadales bacterium]|nr:hypothetical protein [Pseudomonadales bacterium]
MPKATYVHAHTGARSRKVLSGSTLVLARDNAGQLLREHRANGSLVRLYVWADAEPIAQIERALDGSETLAYLHTDRQAMPRLATNAAATVVWRFEARAFGEGGAQTDPDGDGTAVNVRLRYPGQYFDSESGLFDNYLRDYDPSTGRYIESDLVGLAGGLNTYTYANGNPLRFTDPYGLWTVSLGAGGSSTVGKGYGAQSGVYVTDGGETSCPAAGGFVTGSKTTGFGAGSGLGLDWWIGGPEAFNGESTTETVCVLIVCLSSHSNSHGWAGAGISIGGDSGGGVAPGGSFTHAENYTASNPIIGGPTP